MHVPSRAAGVLLAALGLLLSGPAAADYPDRPVRLVVPFPAGGGADNIARTIMPQVAEALGQPIVIDNRPGAGGTLAITILTQSAPDGYMLHLTTSADAWNASLYDKLNFNILRDFAPVATIARRKRTPRCAPSWWGGAPREKESHDLPRDPDSR